MPCTEFFSRIRRRAAHRCIESKKRCLARNDTTKLHMCLHTLESEMIRGHYPTRCYFIRQVFTMLSTSTLMSCIHVVLYIKKTKGLKYPKRVLHKFKSHPSYLAPVIQMIGIGIAWLLHVTLVSLRVNNNNNPATYISSCSLFLTPYLETICG